MTFENYMNNHLCTITRLALWFFSSDKVPISKLGVTNAEPSEDNSFLTAKVAQFTITEGGLDRMQFIEATTIPLGLPEYVSSLQYMACNNLVQQCPK